MPSLPAGGQPGDLVTPFRDQPVALAQAAAIERLEISARALAPQPSPQQGTWEEPKADETDAEEEKSGPVRDFGMFRATLAARAPELEARLAAAIGDMLEAADGKGDLVGPASEVIDLAEEARAVVIPPEAETSTAFRAALMSGLLLEEGGVAEGYEDAVGGEPGAYAKGWAALQHVKALWDGLAVQGSPEQAADVAAMLAVLDGLFPAETPPEQLSPDPEQAEAPAQHLVGLLETVTKAELYPARDLAAAVGLVERIAAQGCTAMEAGARDVGVETLAIAAAYYDQTVADTLLVIAPESATAIVERLQALDADRSEPAACAPLLEALGTGREALTP